MFINKNLLFAIFISIPCTFITLRGWGPDGATMVGEIFKDEQASANAAKQMMLVQKIIAKKTNLDNDKVLGLSQTINNYAFGCNHNHCSQLCNVNQNDLYSAHSRYLALGIPAFLYSDSDITKLTTSEGVKIHFKKKDVSVQGN